MRRLTAVLASVALLACGSEPTALDGGPQVVQSVEIIEGDGQTVQVTESTDTVSALVEDDLGNALSGQLTSWEVDGPSECGNWEATSLESNASGLVNNVLHAGTVADTRGDVDCTFRVVHSEEGAPAPLVDSVEVAVEPGAIADDGFEAGLWDEMPAGDSTARPGRSKLEDTHGNPIPYFATISEGPFSVDSARAGGDATGWPVIVLEDTVGTGSGTITRGGSVHADMFLRIDPQGATRNNTETGEVDTIPSLCLEYGITSASEAENCTAN